MIAMMDSHQDSCPALLLDYFDHVSDQGGQGCRPETTQIELGPLFERLHPTCSKSTFVPSHWELACDRGFRTSANCVFRTICFGYGVTLPGRLLFVRTPRYPGRVSPCC